MDYFSPKLFQPFPTQKWDHVYTTVWRNAILGKKIVKTTINSNDESTFSNSVENTKRRFVELDLTNIASTERKSDVFFYSCSVVAEFKDYVVDLGNSSDIYRKYWEGLRRKRNRFMLAKTQKLLSHCMKSLENLYIEMQICTSENRNVWAAMENISKKEGLFDQEALKIIELFLQRIPDVTYKIKTYEFLNKEVLKVENWKRLE